MSTPNNVTIAGLSTYSGYTQHHTFDTDTGIIVCPVASRSPGHKRIQLHGGVGMRRVSWRAARSGKPPIIPAADHIGLDKLIGHSVTSRLPIPNTRAAGYDWDVSGEYIYVQDTPRVAGTDTIPTGAYPFPIAPNDSIANQIGNGFTSAFTNASPGTNGADAFYQAVSATVDHVGDQFLWPFTALPPSFTTTAFSM